MSLLELAEKDLSAFEDYNIQQVVAICGDGNLLDGSECSKQLRRYLSIQSSKKLGEYASYCLETSFPKSGAVLQDIVNEVGRRLGYGVRNGRYSGSTKEVGFDGLWEEGEAALVVEVKTTDAYRINLDTVVNYATRSVAEGIVKSEPTVLLVVGRQDTGDLEAQVRGSRHAWQIRLVSVDSLLRLMSVRADMREETFVGKVRRILLPFEYTRVDHIIDLVFESQREVEDKIIDADAGGDVADEPPSDGKAWIFTPTHELNAKRHDLLERFYRNRGGQYRRVTPAQYINDTNNVRVACSISKRYDREHQPYWFAFHPSWLEFLESGAEGYFILGCMDREEGFAIPINLLVSHLSKLYTTERNDKVYWHIALGQDDEGLFLNLPKTGEKLHLKPLSYT